MSMYLQSKKIRMILVAALFILLTSIMYQRYVSPVSAATFVAQAWENVERSDSYTFSATIEDTAIPLATIDNIGRFSKTTSLYVEGDNNLRNEELQMAIWGSGLNALDQANAYQIRIHDDQVSTRVGEEAWQPSDNMNVAFAPGGDFLAFLDVATDVQLTTQALSRSEETTTNIPDPRYTIYEFNINGPAYAQQLIRTNQDYLVRTGQLPAGVALQGANYLNDITGSGELWIDGRGLPVREIVTLYIPPAEGADYRSEIKLDVHFTNFEGELLAATWQQPGQIVAAAFASLPLPSVSELGFNLFALGAFSLFTIVVVAPNRRTLRLVNSLLLVTILATPLLQAEAAETTREQISHFEEKQETAVPASPIFSRPTPYTLPVTRNQITAAINRTNTTLFTSTTNSLQMDPNLDTDADGLPDYVEQLVGANPYLTDTDSDGISDQDEVLGFNLGSQWWYGNPANPDSNGDGIVDGLAWELDTDGDAIPDLYDDDSDNDTVPNIVDLSPFSTNRNDLGTSIVFTQTNPLNLTINGLNKDSYTFVDFQLRPTNPDRLWYAFNVLNWPADKKGTMQDWDNATFFDHCRATGGVNCTMGLDDNGDIKFVPMLEILLPDLSNIPHTANGQVDQALLDKYSIALRPANNGSYYAYVPLNVVQDPYTGSRVAFQAQMVYQAGLNWGTQQARMVWLVQVLNEEYEDEDEAARIIKLGGGTGQNSATVLHVYADEFYLTGLNVREDRGVEMAIVYEDPAVDNALEDDDGLIQMTTGLENTFFVNRDCDFVNNEGVCVGDGKRDITIAEIQRRWNHPTNNSITLGQRWGIPDQLRVETYTFAHQDEAIFEAGGEIAPQILDTHFTDEVETANLLYVREVRLRSLNADVRAQDGAVVAWTGTAVTVDFSQETIVAQANYNLAPYRYNQNQDGWEPFPVDEYADKVLEEFNETTAGLTEEEAGNAAMVEATATVGTIGVVTMVNGSSSTISNNAPVQPGGGFTASFPPVFQDINLSDDDLRFTYTNALLTTTNRFIQLTRYHNDELFDNTVLEKLFRFQQRVGEHDNPGDELDAINGYNKKLSHSRAAVVIFSTVLVLAGIGGIIAMHLPKGRVAGEAISLSVAAVGAVVQATTTVAELSHFIAKSLPKNTPTADISKLVAGKLLNARYALTSAAAKAAAVGAVIGVVITWVVFFAAWGKSGITAGSLEFNNLLAGALATTLVLVLTFVLSLSVVGSILLAVFAIFDLLAFIICKAGAKGACDIGITAVLTQMITDWIYQGEAMIDTSGNPPIVNIEDIRMKLTQPDRGLVVGNGVRFEADMLTWIRHAYPKPSVVYHYGSFFTPADLQSTTVKYQLATAEYNLRVQRGQSTWQLVRSYDVATALVPSPVVGWLVATEQSKVLWEAGRTETIVSNIYNFTEAKINQQFPLWLLTGMALPRYDCWFSVCSHKTIQTSTNTNLGERFILDILPATVDGLYFWIQLGPQQDRDNDGLQATLDANDTKWDQDGDTLSDWQEANFGSNPALADADTDGLTDAQEKRFETNPRRADSDGDGLSDYDEIMGYDLVVGSYTTRVTSNAQEWDGDGDGMSDGLEHRLNLLDPVRFPFHPRVINDPPLRLYTTISDADQVLAIGDSATITTTVLNGLASADELLVSGRFTSTLPAELGSATDSQNFTLLPTGQREIVQTGTAVSGQRFVGIETAVFGRVYPIGSPPPTSQPDIVMDEEYAVTIDNDNPNAPTLTLGSFVEPDVEVVIGGVASDPTSYVALVEVSVDGGPFVAANGTNLWAFGLSIPNQPAGTINIAVRVTDAVGHTNSANFTVTIDSTSPITTLDLTVGETRSLRRNADGDWTLSLSGESSDDLAGVSEVELRIGANSTVTATVTVTDDAWSLIYPFDNLAFNSDPTPNGPLTLTVTTRDNALPGGNVTTQEIPFIVDMSPPTVALLSHADGVVLSDGDVLTGTVQDNYSAVSNIEIAFVSAETVLATGETFLHLPLNDLPETVLFNNVATEPARIYCLDESCPQSYVSGTDGTAVSFDGNDTLRNFDALSLPATDLTIALWFNTTCANCGLFSAVEGDFPTITQHDHDIFLDGGKVCTSILTGVSSREVRCSVAANYNNGQWHQVVHTLGTNGNQLYIDGQLAVNSPTTTSFFSNTTGIVVGHSVSAVSPYFTGQLDDVVVYKGALSPAVAASLYRQWQPVTLVPGQTPAQATWAYTVPPGLEGYYQVDIRAADSLGNRVESRGEWPQYRGPIDTAPPTFDVSVVYSGSGSAAQTRYTTEVTDRNLVTDGYTFACALQNNHLVYETDPALLGFGLTNVNDGQSLAAIEAECIAPGYQTSLVSAHACDDFGHCGAAIPPQTVAYVGTRLNTLNPFGSLPNAIERTNLSDPRNRIRLIERPGRVIYDIEVDQANGKLYWTEGAEVAGTTPSGEIWRANLDGSSPQRLHNGLTANLPEMLQIALDPAGNKLYWTAGYQLYWSNLDGSQTAVVYSIPNDPRIVGGNQQYQAIGDVVVDPINGKLYISERRNRLPLGTNIFPHSLIVEMTLNGANPAFVAGVADGCTYANWNDNLGTGVGQGQQPSTCLDLTGGMDVESLAVANGILYWAAYEPGGVNTAVYGKTPGHPPFTIAPLTLTDNSLGINYGPVPHLYANPLSGAVLVQYGTQIVRGEPGANNTPGIFSLFTDFLDTTPPPVGATTRKSSTLTALAIVETGGTLETKTDLAVEITSRDLVLVDGESGSYNLTLRNLSPLPAADSELALNLPTDTTFAGASLPCANNGNTVTCDFDTFAPFDTQSVVISFTVATSEVRPLSATAVASSSVQDTNPANNSLTFANITAAPTLAALPGLPYIYYSVNSTQLLRIPLFGDYEPEPMRFDGHSSIIYQGTGNALATSPDGETLYLFDHTVNLMSLDANGTNQVVLADANPADNEPGFGRNLTTAVDPTTGRIYYAEMVSWYWSRLKSMNPDGSDIQTLNDRVLLVRGLTVDYLRGKLYWIGSDNEFQHDLIYRSNLNGSNVEVVYTAPTGSSLRDLAIDPYTQRLYWVDPMFEGGSLFWADTSGQRVEMLASYYGSAIRGLIVRPEQNALYYATEYALFRNSLDGSNEEWLTDIDGSVINAISNLNPNTFFWGQIGSADSNLAYVIASSFPPSPCVAADPNEPNDTAATATLITDGSETAALCRPTLNTTQDIDYYQINIPSGQQAEITLTNLPADYSLQARQGDGIAGTSLNSGLTDEFLAIPNYTGITTTYTIIVYSSAIVNNNTLYTLETSLVAAPPQTEFTNEQCLSVDPYDQPGIAGNHNQANATPLTVGAVITGALCYKFDTDFYSFSGTAGQTVIADLLAYPADYGLFIYRPDGSFFNAFGPTLFGTSFRLDASGTWAVAVQNQGHPPTMAQYQLLVQDATCSVNDAYEPNDLSSQATALSSNRRVSATLCNASDVDYYSLTTTTPNQQLTIDYPVNAAGAEIKLTNANGTVLGSILPGTQHIFTLASAGNYHLEVVNSALNSSDVPYNFLWQVGNPVSLGEPYIYFGNWPNLSRVALSPDHTITPFFLEGDGYGYPDHTIASAPTLGKLYLAGIPQALIGVDYSGFNRTILPYEPNPGGIAAPVAVAIDEVNGYIFWTQPFGGLSSVSSHLMRGNLDGSGTPYEFPFLILQNQAGLLVDQVRGELYFVSDNAIYRSSLDGTNQITVRPAVGGEEVHYLTIDALNRYLYWIDPLQGTLMRRSLVDGSETALITGLNDDPHGVVVRPEKNELYYTNGLTLYRATLNGNSAVSIATFGHPYQGPSNLDPEVYPNVYLAPPNNNMVLGYGSPIVSPCTLADGNEPNNDSGSAIPTTVITETVIQAALCYDTTGNVSPDEDYYAVEVGNGRILTATLSNLPADYTLVIIHPDGYAASFSNNDGLAGEQATIANTSGVTVTYQVVVRTGAFNMIPAQYTLQLIASDVPPPPNPNDPECSLVDGYDAPAPDGNGTINSATDLAFDTAYSAALCYTDDVDMYAFNGLTGQSIKIGLPTRPEDYTLTLYDPNGISTIVISSTTTPAYGDSFVLPATGRWTVAVSQDNLNPTTNQYTLVITDENCVSGDAYEPNNSEGAASAISDGSRVRATLCSASDVDVFMFNATAGQELTLNYPVNSSGAFLRLYPAGQADLGQVTAGTQGIFTITSSGQYFIEVVNGALSGRAVPYMFQLLLGTPTPPPSGLPYLYDVNSAYLVRADIGAGSVEPILLDNNGNSYQTIASDTVRDYLYVRTVSQQIGRVHPDGTGFEIVIPNANPNGVLRQATSLAVDEQNGRIYWVEPTFGVVGRILSANGDGSDIQNVVPSVVSDQAIVIDPVGGYLYWVENAFYQTSVEYQIGRSNLDGSNPQVIYVAYGRQIQDLALDPFARKLYWVDPTQQNILWMDADGGPAESLLSLDAPGRGLVVQPFDNTIYFSAGDSLRRADLDGSNVSEIARQTGQYTGISNLDPGAFFLTTLTKPESNLVLAYSEPFAAPCAAVDNYEPNNTIGEAAEIQPGVFTASLCTADLNTPDLLDYYQVAVSNGQQISVTLSQLPQDYALFLLAGGVGVEWSYNPGLSDEFVTHVNDSGAPMTYTIGVNRFAGNDSRQPYTMTVGIAAAPPPPPPPPPPADACAPVDPYDAPGYAGNWNRDQATLINYNTPITAALCYAADKDYYAFDGVLGQNVTINLSPRPADYYITLYDPDGNYTTGIFPGSFLNYGGEYTLSATGRWTIAIWYPNLAPTTDQYTLELTFDSDCFGADPYEPNDEYYSNPTPILSRTLTLRNVLCQSGGNDQDYYTFPVVTGERVRVTPHTLAAGTEMVFQVPGMGFGFTTEPIDFIANNDGDFLLGFLISGGMWQHGVDNVPYVVDIQIDPVPTPPTTPNNWTCNTYNSDLLSTPITDLATFGLSLNVPVSGAVTHVGLRDLTLEHNWLIDVAFGLQSPDGTTEELFAFDDYGFYTWCGDSDCQLSLDDWAQPGLVPPQFPTTGDTYLPTRGSFSAFDGVESSGNWTLLVTDWGPSGDFGEGYQYTTGVFKGWGLEVCYDNGNPPDEPPPAPPPPAPDPEPGDTSPPGNTDPLETPPPPAPESCEVALPDAFENDNTFTSASPFILASLTSSDHTLHSVTDADWMAFDAIAGLEYTFTAVSTQPASYTGLAIFEPDGTTVVATDAGIVSFEAANTATYYLRVSWNGGIAAPCNYTYSVAAEVVNPNPIPVPEPDGDPAPPSLDQPIVSSAILVPAHQQVFTEVAQIPLEIGLSASHGITAATLLVNGIPQTSYTVLPESPEYDAIWYDSWMPAASGVYTLSVLMTDTNGVTATSSVNVVYVDTADPAITIAAETITQAKLTDAGLYALRGTANDDAAISKVELQIDGGPWQEAVLEGNEWLYLLTPLSQANPDGGMLTLNARATDVAGRTTITSGTLILDVIAPASFTVATSLTNGDLISPTLVTAGLNSRLTWPAAITGSVGVYAGWTAVSTPTLGLLTEYSPGTGLHDELQTEATVRYAHVIAVDANGNETAVTSGPFYFDTAPTPDLISDLAFDGWTDSGGKQVGQMETAVYGTQQLFAGWNADTLRLRWHGLNVDSDGDLYLYLGTSGSGTTALLNPFGTEQSAVLPFTANYVIYVSDNLTATLYSATGGNWTAISPVAIAALGQTTDLLLPFADLGIADPAGTTLHLLGLASTEGKLDVWATVPDMNLGRPYPEQSWTQYIEWGSLGSGIVPADGVWANAPIEAVVVANPDPATLVGAGDTVTLTLTYSNTGSATLPQLTFNGTGSGLSLNNAPQTAVNIPANGTGSLTLTGIVNTSGFVTITLTDTYHRPYLLDVFTYTGDTFAPISVTVSLDYVGAITNTILASAQDASPLASIEVEINSDGNLALVTCLPGSGTQDAFVCLWHPGTVSDGDSYTLRARATDVHGNLSNWSDPVNVEADATSPLLTLSAATQDALSDNMLNINEMTLVGTLTDERVAVSTLACLTVAGVNNCVSADVLPDGSWSLPLPGSYDGITATLTVVGFDTADNPSASMIQTVWLDTAAPTINTAVTPAIISFSPDTAALMSSGTVIDASGLSAVRALLILPDGGSDTVNGQVNGNTWEVSYLFAQEGVHEAVVMLTDGAGNQRIGSVWQFTAESTGVVLQPDIQLTNFTADGNTTITVAYTIANTSPAPFTLGFYTSADNTYQSGDTFLSTVTISDPADRTVGSHVKTFTLGVDAELVNAANETDLDYYILTVADATDVIAETDNNAHNEDNTAVFAGIYHKANQPVFVHGSDTADTITASGSSISALTLTLNGTPFTYNNATTLYIRAHNGHDTINLSAVSFTATNFKPFVAGGAGNDSLTGGQSNDTFVGGPGNDTLNGGASDTASYTDSPTGVAVNLTTGTASDGHGGTDNLTNINNVSGSAFSDSLTGNMAANILIGNGGDDSLDGQRGNDILIGGAGNDVLIGGNGADTANYATSPAGVTVNLAAGTATQDGFGTTDTLVTMENLTGSAYNDSLTGDNGRNTLSGGDGHDTLVGGAGADTLQGMAGNDTLYANSATSCADGAVDRLIGGTNSDIGYYSATSDNDTVNRDVEVTNACS